MKAYPFTIIYLIPVTVVLGCFLGGIFTFLTPVLVFGLIPILDLLIGYDFSNPDKDRERYLEERKSFRIITWIAVPIALGLVIWGSWIISLAQISILEFFGLSISVGINSGVLGINCAHEMQHRVNNRLEPTLARICLLPSLYIHWGLEHVTGHHRWVATPEDPATAKLNQSYYRFWPQTVFGSIKSAWKFEIKRLKRMGKNMKSTRNRVLHYAVYELFFLALITYIFGLFALVFTLFQAVVSVSLLEVINYIEHYGLLRKKQEDGEFEPVKPHHSWNSSKRLTNWFLINLQRHSDHHYKPGRRYQILRHFKEAPQLPTGYAGMVLIALIPPLYKKIINKRVPENMK